MKYVDRIESIMKKHMWTLFIKFLAYEGKKDILYYWDSYDIKEVIRGINNGDYDEISFFDTMIIDNGRCEETKYQTFKNKWTTFYYKAIFNKTKEEILTDFLKEKKCYEQFISNLHKSSFFKESFHNVELRTYSKYCKIKSLLSLIDNAFSWSETKEGFDYWGGIDDDWADHINELYRNYRKSLENGNKL